jgi:hypothetical protein
MKHSGARLSNVLFGAAPGSSGPTALLVMQNPMRDVMLHCQDQPDDPAMPLRRGLLQDGHPSGEEDEEKEQNRAGEHETEDDLSRWDRHGDGKLIV